MAQDTKPKIVIFLKYIFTFYQNLPPLAPSRDPQSKQKKEREPASTWEGNEGMIYVDVLPHPQDVEDHHADGAMHHFEAKANAQLEHKVEDHVASSDVQ